MRPCDDPMCFHGAVRIAWECKGYMYFVNASPSECLDVCRALWLTGAEYVSAHTHDGPRWKFSTAVHRSGSVGGYSNS